MITREIFETIEGLNQTYFEKWGCAVDYSETTKNILSFGKLNVA